MLPPTFAAMLDVVRERAAGMRVALNPDRLDGDWILDGNVDDGRGPGRLFISVTSHRGVMLASPCLDQEFVQGGRCTMRVLADGSRLFLRDIVEANDVRTVTVAFVRIDRSGITAEASNFPIDQAGPARDGVAPTREDPILSVAQLGELVLAIEDRVRQLPRP